jgi:putative PIN family toxin of toxin-antitoxin system
VKIVLDTNVLASGMLFAGPPQEILRAWSERRIELALSPEIEGEYRRVAARYRRQFPTVDLDVLLSLVLIEAELCRPTPLTEAVSAGPADDKFLACAITSEADAVISGDKHLLRVSGHRGVAVMRPRAFVDRYLSR